tara:strand:+ start:1207 stop:1842 length:636 start_codon:yes stop_codon:yes gene_type:complete
LINIVIIGVGFPDILRVIEAINKKNKQINLLGFLDDNPNFKNKKFWGYRVLGNISWLKKNKNYYPVNSVASNMELREKIDKKIKKYSSKRISLIDPSVNISSTKISPGVIINEGVTIGHGVQIKEGTILSFNVNVGHGSKIDKFCFLASGSSILGNCHIEKKVFIGSNSTILPKIKVGESSTIGINTNIISNVPKKSLVTLISPKNFKKFS